MTPRQVLKSADEEIDRAERLLEVAHVAKRLSVCDETVRRWISAGKLPAIKLDRGWRVSQGDLDAFLHARRPTFANIVRQHTA